MKSYIFLFFLVLVFVQGEIIAQGLPRYIRTRTPANQRVSIIVGPGASFITRHLYATPAVNPTNYFVTLQKAPRIKSNLSMGIAYTPKYHGYEHTVSGRTDTTYAPRGLTFSLFFNPVTLNKITQEQSFFTSVDFGAGVGFRTFGGFLFMGTVEFFSVRQPRDWFIDKYKNNNEVYEINGNAQLSIDTNDDNIFITKPVITFGFKLCYTFDVVKKFAASAKELNETSSQL